MCLGSPSAPAAAPVEKPQEAKMAEQAATSADGSMSDARKKAMQNGGTAASTLLTGPSGVENSSLNLSKASTLLGA